MNNDIINVNASDKVLKIYKALEAAVHIANEDDTINVEDTLNALLNYTSDFIIATAKKDKEVKATESYCTKLKLTCACKAAIAETLGLKKPSECGENAVKEDGGNEENTVESDNGKEA